MKRIGTVLLALCLSFLLAVSALADGIYEPEEEFFLTHRDECETISREAYMNGVDGYGTVYASPDGKARHALSNGESLRTLASWKDEWYLVQYIDQRKMESGTGWTRAADLVMAYDGISFLKEHGGELEEPAEPFELDQRELSALSIWSFPGAEELFSWEDSEYLNIWYKDHGPILLDRLWKDPLGQIWGRISGYKSYDGAWVCLDAPEDYQAPWLNEAATREGQLRKLIPATAPPQGTAAYRGDILWLQLALAAGVVLLALVLLTVFRKKGKGSAT